jgi:hypothetical protein
MTKKLLFVLSIFCALTLVALAADVSGKWTWEQQGRNGATTSTLTLKADGAHLTGSLDGGRGGAIEITDGNVNGDSITFTVKRDMGGQTMSTAYKGTLSGDTLTIEFTRPGRGGGEPTPVKVTAKRSTT